MHLALERPGVDLTKLTFDAEHIKTVSATDLLQRALVWLNSHRDVDAGVGTASGHRMKATALLLEATDPKSANQECPPGPQVSKGFAAKLTRSEDSKNGHTDKPNSKKNSWPGLGQADRNSLQKRHDKTHFAPPLFPRIVEWPESAPHPLQRRLEGLAASSLTSPFRGCIEMGARLGVAQLLKTTGELRPGYLESSIRA